MVVVGFFADAAVQRHYKIENAPSLAAEIPPLGEAWEASTVPLTPWSWESNLGRGVYK